MFKNLVKNFVSKKEGKSFYNILLFSFLTVSIISTLLLSVFLTANYLKAAISSARSYNQQLLSQTNYAIDQMNENVDRLAVSLLNSNEVVAFLSLNDRSGTAPVLAGHAIDKQMMVLPYIESIYLYNSTLDLIYSSQNGYQQSLEEFEDKEISSRLLDAEFPLSYDGEPIPGHKDTDTGAYEIFSYYILDKYSKAGIPQNAIVINVYGSTLTDSIRSMKSLSATADTGFLLLDQNRGYLTGVLEPDFMQNRNWIEPVLKVLNYHGGKASSIHKINGTYYFQSNTNENEYGWYLVNFIPAKLLFQQLISTTLIGTFILLIVFMFTCMICFFLARRLNSPLENVTHLLNEKRQVPKDSYRSEPKEIQMILSSFTSLLENNTRLRSLQEETKYSLTQSFLNKLVTNRYPDSPVIVSRELEHLDLKYLKVEMLHMAVLKIDDYQKFLINRNPDELWAMRFSVANIADEIASAAFTCNVFSRNNDKFVLLMACHPDEDSSHFEEQMLNIFHSIQENVFAFLHFTVTISYSTVFQGLDNLPTVYKNMENSLLLKMRCGHNAIIDPWQMDETNTDSFHLSTRSISPLIDRLAEGQTEKAWIYYEKLTETLFNYDYNEIISTMIHLAYSIYERMAEKYPMLKDSMTKGLKAFLAMLEGVEFSADVQGQAKIYLSDICSLVRKLKEDPTGQNSSIITQKIIEIVGQNYASPALCLCSIAEEIGLSPNYIGQIFRQNMQKSVAQYLLELRMDKAAAFLRDTGLPLQSILNQVGLEKNNYFYTKFKKHFGMSLGEYRQQFCSSSGNSEGD